jgi:Zn-dependent peptidase ImmA (M78 family)
MLLRICANVSGTANEAMSELSKQRRAGKPMERGGERRGPAYARALLAELPENLSVLEIVSALELELRHVQADGFEGALIRAKDIPVGAIVVRDSIREGGRRNFTIAHEIGHFVLPGHDQASLACTASDVANWASASARKELEREADEFAAELLMPASLVDSISQGVPPSLQVIEKIARQAGASLSAAAWRYCDLATEKCAVVWSTEGVIQWSKRAPRFPFFLAKGKPVEDGTFAAACFAGEKVPGRPREIRSDLWIGPSSLGAPARLLEQSKPLPSYHSVISLLWIEEADG